jgi:RES domain-containing protein
MTVAVWRIAADTPTWTADDMAGKGAAANGGRWNAPGERVTYASTSISLAAWETRVHLGRVASKLPFNRILVRIDIPQAIWDARQSVQRPLPVGWNAVPEGLVLRSIGSTWLASGATALLAVPSVVVEEEDNVLINPAHPDARKLTVNRVRQFLYDHRI